MAKNVSIWINDSEFEEMKKIKMKTNLKWPEILKLGIKAIEKKE